MSSICKTYFNFQENLRPVQTLQKGLTAQQTAVQITAQARRLVV